MIRISCWCSLQRVKNLVIIVVLKMVEMGDGKSAGTHGHTTASVSAGVVECDWLVERVIMIGCSCSLRRIKDLVIIVDVLLVEMGDGGTAGTHGHVKLRSIELSFTRRAPQLPDSNC